MEVKIIIIYRLFMEYKLYLSASYVMGFIERRSLPFWVTK